MMYSLHEMMIWEGIDKRKFPRVKYQCNLRVIDRGKEDIFDTYTENIGAGGICVVLSKEFDLFKTAELDLQLSEPGDPIHCKGTIVWVIRRRNVNTPDVYEYDIGIEFTDIDEGDRKKIAALVEDILSA